MIQNMIFFVLPRLSETAPILKLKTGAVIEVFMSIMDHLIPKTRDLLDIHSLHKGM